MTQLSDKEAYLAMYAFLLEYYSLTQAEGVGDLLSILSLLEDGTPADPAMTNDWARAVEKAKHGEVDARQKLFNWIFTGHSKKIN